jgi:CHAT domain-containing protein/Flp pilus assembly protein TadD
MRNQMAKARRVYGIVIAMAIAMLLAQSTAMASRYQQRQSARSNSGTNQSEVRRLEVGKPIERELKGGEEHAYEVTLVAGQYLDAVVEQKGVDVVVVVIAPDGKSLMEVDSPNGAQGPEPVQLITEAAGVYRLRVKSPDKSASVGKYEIRINELRAATDNDRVLQEAARLNKEVERLFRVGKYDAALPLAERALEITGKALGADHPSTATALDNLGGLYQEKGGYAKAEPLLIRALAIRENKLGKNDPLTGTSLNNLALLYRAEGDLAKAEPLLVRALEISERVFDKGDPDVAASLNNLGLLYYSKGDYRKAEPLLIRAVAIYQKALGEDHPLTAQSLNNLAGLYRAQGDFAKAEPLLIRALQISERVLGKDRLDTAQPLNNLAGLYRAKGDFAKAEPLYIRALAIREKILDKDHLDVAASVNNLALLYSSIGDQSKAEPLFVRALETTEKVLGKEHPSTANSLNNLASLYDSQSNYLKAEPLYTRALAIRERSLGKDHPLTGNSLHNLGLSCYSRGDYTKAEPLLIRALAIREKALGAQHPDTANSLNTLATLYRTIGDYTRAVEFQSRCNDVSDRDLTRNLASGSERQKLTYLNQTSFYADSTISLHVQSAPNDGKAKQAANKVLLQRKGRALDAMTDAIAALRRRLSPEDQELLNQLQDARSELSVLTLRGAGREGLEKHKANLKALEEQEEKLQNEISQRSAEFRAQSQSQSKAVTIEVIQKAIPRGAALIEFAQYRPVNPKEPDKKKRLGTPRYVAYVLPSQGESLWAELGDAESINEKIDALRKALRDKRRKDVKRLARAVDRDVMQPVRKLLGPTRRVFISPDSALNLIPFAALVDERGEYLVKRYHFTYLTSGRDLLRLQEKIKSENAPVVMADADFDKASNSNKVSDSQSATNNANSVNVANGSNSASDERVGPKLGEVEFEPLGRLVASAEEAREVKRTLKRATVFLRGEATESALKQVSSPSILHIATHGYFLEEEVKPGSKTFKSTRIAVRRKRNDSTASVKLENPSLRSGLFFAGANKGRSGDDDGVLTALEVAGLDLWGTKLVVLSACDTGVGEVLNGQGVQGLRRALVLAGSESQMMSLWPVNDRGTRDLMIDYYKALKAGLGRGEALRQVQLKMLKNPKRRHPFYWASFIQSGEWANLDGKRID